MNLLLDTSAYSAWCRGHQGVAARIHGAKRLFMSSVVVGELLYGFRHGSRYEENLKKLRQLLADPDVELLPVAWVTADRFGRIAAALRSRGAMIPTNDVWIAAQALEVGADLLTFDRHFDRVEGLAVVRPE